MSEKNKKTEVCFIKKNERKISSEKKEYWFGVLWW